MSTTDATRATAELMPAKPSPHSADALSFMVALKPRGSGINHWNVEITGNYSTDCDSGKALGAEFLRFLGTNPTNGNASLLQCIVHDMIDQGVAGKPWTGAHVTFLQSINRAAMATAQMIQEGSASLSAEQRLTYHAKEFAKAAQELDPTAEELWIGRSERAIKGGMRFSAMVSAKQTTSGGQSKHRCCWCCRRNCAGSRCCRGCAGGHLRRAV